MLQSMRNKIKGLVAFFLIGIMALLLAIGGAESLFSANQYAPGEVAEVEGQLITERELQLGFGRERQRLQARFGDNLPAEMLSSENLRGPVLDGLIRRALVAHVAKEGKMTFSDADIDKRIVEIPDFQLNGKFDQQRFSQTISSIGHSTATFRDLMREDMIVNQMQGALLNTDFITDEEINLSVKLSRQTRDFAWVTLPLGNLSESMLANDEEISAHYEENKHGYLTEEQVAVEYIELDIKQLLNDITVDAETVRQQYDEQIQSSTYKTEREAAHIQIEGDDEQAQAKIAEVQQKLEAGDEFSALVSEYSDDFGSRDNGGNLGTSSGDVFPPEFEEALTELSEGEVSGAIEVDGSTHFIKLLSVKKEAPAPFEQEKARIENELKRAEAEERFISQVEELSDLSYNAEALSEVGEQLNLTVGKTALFSRSGAKDAILQDSRVLNAAFSDRVVQESFSSDVINLSPDHAVVVKMVEHAPVRTLTLAEKKRDISLLIKRDKAKAEIAKQALSIHESLDSGVDLAQISEEKKIVLSTQTAANRNAADVPSELLTHIFSMSRPQESGNLIDSLHLENGDYVVLTLSKVTDGDVENLTDQERVSLRSNLASSLAGDEYRAWQEMVRAEADITIYGAEEEPAI